MIGRDMIFYLVYASEYELNAHIFHIMSEHHFQFNELTFSLVCSILIHLSHF